jgi:hypothetical protein
MKMTIAGTVDEFRRCDDLDTPSLTWAITLRHISYCTCIAATAFRLPWRRVEKYGKTAGMGIEIPMQHEPSSRVTIENTIKVVSHANFSWSRATYKKKGGRSLQEGTAVHELEARPASPQIRACSKSPPRTSYFLKNDHYSLLLQAQEVCLRV